MLGTHVTQKGSLVAPDRLRFDFSHYSAITPEELQQIEALVNEQVRTNADAATKVMAFDAAVAAGAMALFGEKYGDKVRVAAHRRVLDRALRRHARAAARATSACSRS